MVVKEGPPLTFSLVDGALSGERLALSRLLTQVENDTPEGRVALDRLYPIAGKAHRIGVTGSPGTGKSSLVNKLARALRSPAAGQPRRVAVVAVDPSSPFTGGAVLGDRVRMRELAGDPGVFIRSMASRGALGGLAMATAAVVQVFDAVGYDVVLIETVGVGQAEVDIARLAHTTLVVEAPGLGDEIQSIKAGILEIADVLVVNKADRPGAENTQRILKAMLDLAKPSEALYHHPRCQLPDAPFAVPEQVLPAVDETAPRWLPPVLPTVASTGAGVSVLLEAIDRHAAYLRETGEWQRRAADRLQVELQSRVQAALVAHWRAGISDETYQRIFVELSEQRLTPAQAVEILLGQTT
ncbi:MAG TPA: methylmalonyl Co-A mutase-associated GTPase MeaB [Anaerolineaceae bacterium]|jgi:LAO/AO transport system kinase